MRKQVRNTKEPDRRLLLACSGDLPSGLTMGIMGLGMGAIWGLCGDIEWT